MPIKSRSLTLHRWESYIHCKIIIRLDLLELNHAAFIIDEGVKKWLDTQSGVWGWKAPFLCKAKGPNIRKAVGWVL